jgi:hypothetical protein
MSPRPAEVAVAEAARDGPIGVASSRLEFFVVSGI